MTTTAITEAPAPQPPVYWSLGGAPARPGVGVPGRLAIARQDQGWEATAHFQRGAAPAAEAPDPAAELVEAVRSATEGSAAVAAIAGLNAKRAALRTTISTFDARIAELVRRRDDPSLIEMPDLGEELYKLDLANDALMIKKMEASRQLATLDAQLRKVGVALLVETRAAASRAEEQREAGLGKRYAELQRELVELASPVLERLTGVMAELRRPDLESICQILMHERGAWGAAPAAPEPDETDELPARHPAAPRRLMTATAMSGE